LVIDFSKVNLKEQQVLVLRNADDTAIQTLGYAINIKLKLCYNEVSSLTFDIPAYVDGVKTPHYDDIIGMRIVDLVGWGQFVLMNPSVSMTGVKEMKSCKAYSLEHELTYKKISLSEGTYNFWSPVSTEDTVLGILLSYLPSWSIGTVDADLIGKYRTFSVDNANLYNFIKSTAQQSYSCIFDFDTYKRTVSVRSTSSHITVAPVYISLNNLAKDIAVDEDTENIFTCLDVNGADGVNIRTVNPLGSNKIYNLDYFMNTSHFTQDIIDRWNSWKQSFASYQLEYYNVSIQRALKTSAILTEEAALASMTGEDLAALENRQAIYIEYLATLSPSNSDYPEFQSKLTEVNAAIDAKKVEISAQNDIIDALKVDKDDLTQELLAIQSEVALSSFFTDEELVVLDRYIKEDSIEDSTFVVTMVDAYKDGGQSSTLSDLTYSFAGSVVTKILGVPNKDLHSVKGGMLTCNESSYALSANVISASLERMSDGSFVLSAYLSSGTLNGMTFPSGSLSLTGSCYTAHSNAAPDADAPNAYWTGTTLSFEIVSAKMYFTRNTTEYEQYSVEWDLFEYGQDCLNRLAYPSFNFKVSVANFLALEDFVSFAKKMSLGQKVYLELGEEQVIQPILIGVEVDFENLSSMTLTFGDKYSISDSAFNLVDLLDQSISMGKTVDTSKFNYNAFIDSGASTSVKQFMDSALDVAKNAILSSGNVAVSWDSSGIKCRKLAPDGSFELEQIAIINNSICFTDDGWQTAKMAIGRFEDDNTGVNWGVVAPSIVGTLLAGQNLVIESEKKDGGVSVFRVDADGALLHNARFDIENGISHIVLDPILGFGIGDYPIVSDPGGTPSWDEDKAKFWVDTDGNIHFKGILEGTTGVFSGELRAATGSFSGELVAATGNFKGIVQASDFQDSSGNSMLTSDYKFSPDYLELKGLSIKNGATTTFSVDSSGNVNLSGNITMTGGSISWANINETGSASYQVAANAYNLADTAYYEAIYAANDVARLANGAYSGTFINGRVISSPTILTNLLRITAPNNGQTSGMVLSGYYSNREYDWLRIRYFEGDGPILRFDSPGGAYAYWEFGSTTFTGRVDFTRATVTGLSATFA